MSSFRYIVGIDLGTSSCALSYIDRYTDNPKPKTLPITQWHEQGLIESDTLPSFCYIAKSKETEQFRTPFSTLPENYIVGMLAQERLVSQADLVVHSAKSWLCHGGVDREAKILPWHSDTLIGDKRLSPVYVSSLYLQHLKDIWNKNIANGREDFQLEKQKIVITVPASFDETASFLTLEASKLAGFKDVSLCEEPQAAFYYWLAQESSKTVLEQSRKDNVILVVDIGGGTTDFSLFKSSWDASQFPKIERLAVSEHILLGGDNIDLALAHRAEKKLQEQGLPKLSGERWARLVFECRRLKEKSLDKEATEDSLYHLSLQVSSGSKLLGQTKTIVFTHGEILEAIAEGFFPFCSKEERPRTQELGLREWGLPYAEDSAVTKHLAAFLEGRHVDSVLFTGGTLIPRFLRDRLLELLSRWEQKPVLLLENDALELAVSRGASLFAYRQVHEDTQVSAGYPRSLYIKVLHAEKQTPIFLCIVPKGLKSTERLRLSPPGLHALLGQVARFELYSSLLRPEDQAGSFVEADAEHIKTVSVLQTRLGEGGKKQTRPLPISLDIRLGASGLLELSCVPLHSESSYPLHFSLETKFEVSTQTPKQELPSSIPLARECIDRFYGKEKIHLKQNPMGLIVELERVLAQPRKDWDLAHLRLLWPPLKEGMNRRNRSEQHELAWLNLAGYVLRPGYGEQMDALRIREVQGLFSQGPAYPLNAKIRIQWWIFWRRLAGGLDRKTQDLIFSKSYPLIKREDSSPELILLLGSLERLDMQKKISLGQWLSSDLLAKSDYREQKIWALTRIANRLPLYGGAESIVRPHFVEAWFQKLIPMDLNKTKGLASFFTQACRRINDRELDISEEWREKVLKKLEDSGHSVEMIKNYVPQDAQTVSSLLGESLPLGLGIFS